MLDVTQYKKTLGMCPTGVYVLSTRNTVGGLYGVTLNSLTSVSLDPPVVSVALWHRSQAVEFIQSNQVFSLSLLSASQGQIGKRFSSRIEDRFDGVEHSLVDGLPVISQCCGYLVCDLKEIIEIGDHSVFFASVRRNECTEGLAPLIYYRSQMMDIL